MLQAESLSANSAYSSSVMRVLTTRLRCGVLYRFRMVKPPFCAWCPLTNRRKTGCEAELFLKNPKKYFEGFLSGASRISRVWGRHSPTRFPQGQNERKANFGTAVESCSKKLPDCAHLLLPLFREIYNQLFHKRLRAGVLRLLPPNHKRAEWTDFPARTFPAARSFPTIRRFEGCVLPAA